MMALRTSPLAALAASYRDRVAYHQHEGSEYIVRTTYVQERLSVLEYEVRTGGQAVWERRWFSIPDGRFTVKPDTFARRLERGDEKAWARIRKGSW